MTQSADILVVEDSRTQAELLCYLLRDQGYEVTAVTDGSQALAAARSHRPALIISDIEMPVMDGYTMCRAMKDEPTLRSVPVILLTSLSDPGDVLRGLEARADYYLTKPYDPDYLLRQVKSILDGHLSTGTAAAPGSPSSGEDAATPIQVTVEGRVHTVTASRREILTLLLSTYGNAVERNSALLRMQVQLQDQNRRLDQSIRSEREALSELKQTQGHLIQTEKLAGLGQMVAGVAHEINNPLAFVSNNMAVLQRDVKAVAELIHSYQSLEVATPDNRQAIVAQIRDEADRIDLPYTLENLIEILVRSRDGLARIQQIVKGLRDFARLDASDLSDIDLNEGIRSVIHIIHCKAVEKQVEVQLEAGELPPVTCYPAKINQVVMNLLNNAIDASSTGGAVRVFTSIDGKQVRIVVEDHGHGIAPEIMGRIFDPFFTTKPVGSGTGLGLSISYGIVRDHGGTLTAESRVGEGARFTVTLPVHP